MSSNKYGNAPTTGCRYGYSHRSKLEAAVCGLIYLRERAGELKHLAHEVHLYLSDARIGYVADFKCADPAGVEFYVEAKGYASDRWPTVKKLYKSYGPGTLEIWGGTWQRPSLIETIVPKGAA